MVVVLDLEVVEEVGAVEAAVEAEEVEGIQTSILINHKYQQGIWTRYSLLCSIQCTCIVIESHALCFKHCVFHSAQWLSVEPSSALQFVHVFPSHAPFTSDRHASTSWLGINFLHEREQWHFRNNSTFASSSTLPP